jgi:F0F1-type ATP synthase membrane subunit b/b'
MQEAEQIPWYVSLIISWLPFIFVSALWYWISHTIKRSLKASDGRSVGQVISDVAAELKRSNDHLEALLNDYRAQLEKSRQGH